MRYTLFAFLFVISGLKSSAQIQKHQWLVGGNANWTTSFNSRYSGSSTVISIMPDAGYFFYNKLAGGLKLIYSIDNPSGGNSYVQYGVSPFVRYYILPSSKLVNVFGQIEYGWNRVDI